MVFISLGSVVLQIRGHRACRLPLMNVSLLSLSLSSSPHLAAPNCKQRQQSDSATMDDGDQLAPQDMMDLQYGALALAWSFQLQLGAIALTLAYQTFSGTTATKSTFCRATLVSSSACILAHAGVTTGQLWYYLTSQKRTYDDIGYFTRLDAMEFLPVGLVALIVQTYFSFRAYRVSASAPPLPVFRSMKPLIACTVRSRPPVTAVLQQLDPRGHRPGEPHPARICRFSRSDNNDQ